MANGDSNAHCYPNTPTSHKDRPEAYEHSNSQPDTDTHANPGMAGQPTVLRH